MAKLKRKYFPYTTYVFRSNEQDPVVDKLRTVYEDAGSPSLNKISGGTRLASGTMSNWGVGKAKWKTRRPQHASCAAFLGYFGKEFAVVSKKVRR